MAGLSDHRHTQAIPDQTSPAQPGMANASWAFEQRLLVVLPGQPLHAGHAGHASRMA